MGNMAKTTLAQLTKRLDALAAQNEALTEQNGALIATIQNGEPTPAPKAAEPAVEGDEEVSLSTLKRAFYAQAKPIRKMRSMPAKLKAAKSIIRQMMAAGIRAKNESPQDGLHRLGKWTRVAMSEATGLARGALWNLEGEVAAKQQVR